MQLNGTRQQLGNESAPCDNGVLLIYNSAKGDSYFLRGLQTNYRLTNDEITVIQVCSLRNRSHVHFTQASAANTLYGDNSSEAHNQRVLKLTKGVRDELINEPIDPHALGVRERFAH